MSELKTIFTTDKTDPTREIVLHGTNGWYEESGSKTCCSVIYDDQFTIVIDLGTGFSSVNEKRTSGRPLFIFLSHLHFDHIYGLHLLCSHRPSMIVFYVPEQLKNAFKTIAAPPFIKSFDESRTPIEINGLFEDTLKENHFEVTALSLKHNTVCFGFRITIEDKVISYCVDTGECDNLFKIAKRADFFICDSAKKEANVKNEQHHLSMGDAFRIAKEAEVKTLILTHFGPKQFNSGQERVIAAKGFDDVGLEYIVAQDDLRIPF